MKELFDKISWETSKMTTLEYSTSFSMGIKVFDRTYHYPIYAIYGFVRFADEIVDSFHGYEKEYLLKKFKNDTYEALDQKISLNPILNSFQHTINKYDIDRELIDTFLKSMEMDLDKSRYDEEGYKTYILGSAEVVGLMCLKIFLDGNQEEYLRLKPHAMSLGSAFQKINFLRDLKADYHTLGRTYFPGVNLEKFDAETKKSIEEDIEKDFQHALEGIRQLHRGVRKGVYLAYIYYYTLFKKIRKMPPSVILNQRVRVPDHQKYLLLAKTFFCNI
jgi:15-cis-phytoene synthase